MSKRKINIPRLILVIVIAAVFLALGGTAIKSVVDRKKELAYKATPTPTVVPTSTPSEDFYVDPEATASPSASEKAEKEKMLEKIKKKTDADKARIEKENNNQDKKESISGLPLQRSFGTVNIRNGISVNARATSGTFAVVLTDANGKQIVAFKKNGPFNEVQNLNVPAGQYKLDVYSNASGWSWSYNLY